MRPQTIVWRDKPKLYDPLSRDQDAPGPNIVTRWLNVRFLEGGGLEASPRTDADGPWASVPVNIGDKRSAMGARWRRRTRRFSRRYASVYRCDLRAASGAQPD